MEAIWRRGSPMASSVGAGRATVRVAGTSFIRGRGAVLWSWFGLLRSGLRSTVGRRGRSHLDIAREIDVSARIGGGRTGIAVYYLVTGARPFQGLEWQR